jgi:coenzyme PQQ precursor peptide PqqA
MPPTRPWLGEKRPAVELVPFVVVCHLSRRRNTMNWTTPTLMEICIGLEINGYLPAEF